MRVKMGGENRGDGECEWALKKAVLAKKKGQDGRFETKKHVRRALTALTFPVYFPTAGPPALWSTKIFAH
jgi:hypothetical protein